MAVARTLFITASAPYPGNTGDRQRSNFLYRALSRVAQTDTLHISSLASLYPEQRERLNENFSLVGELAPTPRTARGKLGLLRPLHPRLIDRFARTVWQLHGGDYAVDPALAAGLADVLARQKYDAIVGRYIRTTVQSGALQYTPVVIDVDDYDPQVYGDRLELPSLRGPARWLMRHRAEIADDKVLSCIACAAHLWLAAPRDVPRVPHPHVSALPNLAFFETDDSPPERLPPNRESKTILIVGNLTASMNVNGLNHFVKSVWPAIVATVPDARLRIVGGGMTEEMRSRWGSAIGVELVGYVGDLSQEYARCAFAAAPIYEGGGTKIKVLEAIQRGRTVALTAHSLRGYEQMLQHCKDVWAAASDTALADGCIRLLRDSDLRDALAAHAAEQVMQFSFANFCGEVKETIQRVTADCGGVSARSGRSA